MSSESAYFCSWSKHPCRKIKAPSYVQAIIRCPGTPEFAAVVCRNGELIAQAPENLLRTKWKSCVKPPAGHEMPVERFQVEYAAYDAASEHFLFVLHSPGDKEVYKATKANLVGHAEGGVELGVLINKQDNKSRSFCGVTVDHCTRVLYTCNYECGTVDLWKLSVDNAQLGAAFIASVDCRTFESPKMEPWYCAVYWQKADRKLNMAISDWESSSIFLFENTDEASPSFTAAAAEAKGADDKAKGFRYAGAVANASDEDKALGTVTYPHEMCFDDFGNLLVADAINDRLQMFKLQDNGEYGAVWSSESPCYHDRAIVIHDPSTKRAIALANNFDTVVTYE